MKIDINFEVQMIYNVIVVAVKQNLIRIDDTSSYESKS